MPQREDDAGNGSEDSERCAESYAPPMLSTSSRSPNPGTDARGFRRKKAPAITPIAKQMVPVTNGWEYSSISTQCPFDGGRRCIQQLSRILTMEAGMR